MKNLSVGTVVVVFLLLPLLGGEEGPFDALWTFGALVLFAYLLQQAALSVGLPPLIGWLTAGLVMGAGGFHVVHPDGTFLVLMRLSAAVVVGFRVGLHGAWPRGMDWRGPFLVGLGTLLGFVLTAAGIVLIVRQPMWVALLLAAFASLWGLFVDSPRSPLPGLVALRSMGAGFSLLLLSGVLIFLRIQSGLPSETGLLVVRLGASLAGGAAMAALLRWLGAFRREASSLIAFLCTALFAAGISIYFFHLYALPFGFAAGLVVSRHPVSARRVRFLARRIFPAAFLIFFSLMGTAVDVKGLYPLLRESAVVLLIQTLILLFVRGAAPVLYYPLSVPSARFRRTLGLLLLPRGALLFELVLQPGGGLLSSMGGEPTRILSQVILFDVLLCALLFPGLSSFVERRMHRLPPSEKSGAEDSSVAADEGRDDCA